ncbi:MAG: glycosyltransferase [Candidatus Edwardsbacteria bacterium]|jgi:GT2 family glycosyltransferase|nr:glycosyltransferase [Candidatus Edwardsbacteria bacterium]
MNIIAVVVLYQCRPDESSTIASLVRSWEHCPQDRPRLTLVIHDNGPAAQDMTVALPFEHQYLHDPSNGGLARAYNRALAMAAAGRYEWLLLLDQDSSLPDRFLAVTRRAGETIGPGTVAVVPRVADHGVPVSPARLRWGGMIRPLAGTAAGVLRGTVTAINSGTLIRTSFMADLGGFNEAFPLDYLDHWLFAMVRRQGRTVYATEAVVGHDLSIGQRLRRVTPGRYRSVLRAETRYYRTCCRKVDFIYHLLAVAARACRQALAGDRVLSRLTLRHLSDVLANREHR